MASTSPTCESALEQRCRRLERQITTTKHVSSLRKNLLELRERQVKDLISKLKYYEVLVGEERESRHSLSNRLEAAETQCDQLKEKLTKNIHTIDEMKANYENKVSTLINELQTSEQRNQQLSDQLNCAQLRLSEVTMDETVQELRDKLDEKNKLLTELQKQVKRVWDRNKVLSYQMSLLNNLFSETEGVTIDFEKIKAIGDIVRESQSLAEETEDDVQSEDQDSERRPSVDLENLLDSIEKSERAIPAEIPGEESCYKSVDTKGGPQLVLSVSRTFIKLKDLIVEKKSLQKEIDTLKTLNTKLESKVDKQEHRLYRVTMELNKTWSLVSKLKQQHKRLYNSEAVLRYELQEKRALLEKLKNELSASREKWRRVRQKNSQSQIEWEKLRDEFAQRKHQSSQESGTFSEVMSVSSGENDVTTLEEEEAETVTTAPKSRGSRSKVERPKTLPLSHRTTSAEPESAAERQRDFDDEEGAEDEDFEEGAGALSPLEDENYSDPLEELVSELVEEIDNEADTEEERTPSRAQLESESSPSPDFEDRMRRRASRLRMLEEQCHVLHQKLVASTARSVALSSKLAELHDHYGPAGSATGTPNGDQQDHEHASHTQSEMSSNSHTECTTVETAQVAETSPSTSVACASGSGAENNCLGSSSTTETIEIKPEFNAQNEIPPAATAASENDESTGTNCPAVVKEIGASEEQELISASKNSSITVSSSTENNNNDIINSITQQESQGHTESATSGVTTSTASVLLTPSSTSETPLSSPNDEPQQSQVTEEKETEDGASSSTTKVIVEASEEVLPINAVAPSSLPAENSEASHDANLGNTSQINSISCNDGNDGPQQDEQQEDSHNTQMEQQDNNPASTNSSQVDEVSVSVHNAVQEASQAQVETQVLSSSEEPLPIIQETVVQHFPSPTEEEANEFAPVQIRPEFLRILQEADEATNANSLDWMPSLLTITHSVALLRLDPDVPSATSSSSRDDHNNSRSLSESLRIEIPRQSPSPPPATATTRHHRQRQEVDARTNAASNNDDRVSSHDEEDDCEPSPAQRRDPSFLSRMIIKQLPKRLRLLKNENHMLEMEATEAKMRMKEMKRQLTKDVQKQQDLVCSLDAQIEDKNLVEFELREELEKKEKVIEELQMEINESKEYVDEIKKEKDEIETYFKVFIDEKLDMDQPKVAPASVKDCHNCKRPFSFLTRRKYHCKICGKVFCKDCAIQREPFKRSAKRPRLCTRCHFRRQRLITLVNASKQSSEKEN